MTEDPYREPTPPKYVAADFEEELEAEQIILEQPCWSISRTAAGAWLYCRLELPNGGSIVVQAPTLDAIRCMDIVNDNWVDAAKKAAGR